MTRPPGVLERLQRKFPPGKIQHRPEVLCRACLADNCVEHQTQVCEVCHQLVSTAHTHIDYVGHAEVTRRLNETDPRWSWEPMALTEQALPLFDSKGGLWINLTVHAEYPGPDDIWSTLTYQVTRPGYGHAGSNAGTPNGDKEAIGDAIRNAAMRFGVALDLWAGERTDRVMVDGIPGLPSGPAKDPRAPWWDLIAELSRAQGRTENRQITEHWTAWTAAVDVAGGVALGEASILQLSWYLNVLAGEPEATA